MRIALAAVATVAASLALGGSAICAAADYVDLELILAVDVSRSMDFEEQKVQRDGYVKALRSPEILQAIRSGPIGRIAITYMEWSSSYYQQTVVPWTVVSNQDEIGWFADALAAAPIATDSRTSIANALLYAQSYFNQANWTTDRRTIDVSGDGSNNDGTTLMPVRDRLVANGIVINGLPILIRPSSIFGPFGNVRLDDYYKACVIGGPGSFVIPIQNINEFEPAIRRKLILEIASVASNIVPVSALRSPMPNVDCNAADQQRNFNDPSFLP